MSIEEIAIKVQKQMLSQIFDITEQHTAEEKLREKCEGISRDVTERKQMERELIKAREAAEAASRAKSQFIANMSHELRTPLNAILGYGQILLRDQTLSKNQRRNIDVMKTSGEHLLTLINDVLDIARIEAGKMQLDPGPTNLKSLIANIASMLRLKARQKSIDLIEDVDPDLPRFIEADEKRLRQTLLNLLSNAVKFTEKGVVTISARTAGDCIEFSVSDTGTGVPEDKLTEIFAPFQQLNPFDGKTEGTGLGLTISQQIVRLMGGEITVESQPGQGSVFRFKIPLVDINGRACLDNFYSDQDDSAALPEINQMALDHSIDPPPKADLAALHAMSRIGDLSSITAYVQKMRESAPETSGFCRTVERHSIDCNIGAIRQLIERFMGEDK